MNVNDIHIGDILISKDGDEFKITDFYPLNNDDNDYLYSFVIRRRSCKGLDR